MSTKLNTNLKPVELTPAELDFVAGGKKKELPGASAFVIKKIPV